MRIEVYVRAIHVVRRDVARLITIPDLVLHWDDAKGKTHCYSSPCVF